MKPFKTMMRLEQGMNKEDLEPLAYRLGSIPFIHTEIYLDSRPLIPRTETEYWVDIVIKEIRESGIDEPVILDLCAGSGCIGVAVLKEIPQAQVDFAEIETAHHPTIKKNIIKNNLDESHTRIFGGDLFENVTEQYDFILANPPYLNPILIKRVQESVLEYEPEEALFGGQDGLELINKIIAKTPQYLKEGGVLYLEHEPEQVETLSKHHLYKSSYKDQFGLMRYSVLSKQGRSDKLLIL